MNKKYVIGYENQCVMICQNKSDAAEMLLSLAEENIYENWFYDNFWGHYLNERKYETPAEFIKYNGENQGPTSNISDWGWALYSYSSDYWIDEVVCVD